MGRLTFCFGALAALFSTPAIAGNGDALVDRALEAHGGLGVIEAAGGAVLTGTGFVDLSAMQQGRHPDAEERQPATQQVVVDLADKTTSHFYDWYNYAFSNQRLYERYDAAGRVLFADLTNGGAFWPPFRAPEGAAQSYRRYLPSLLLAEAESSETTLIEGGPFLFDGREVEGVTFVTHHGEPMQLFFETQTGLLAGVRARIDAELVGESVVEFAWSDYADENGWVKPARLTSRLGGKLLRELALTITPGTSSAPDRLDGLEIPPVPENQIGAEEMPLPAFTEPRSREVSDGVWLFPSVRPGFHMLAVEFEDFVVAVDAPAGWYELEQIPPHQIGRAGDGEALTRKFIRGIESAIPGKPIRYAVMTHHHSDHIGGFRAFAERGTTLVASVEVASAIRAAHSSDPALAEPQFVLVDGEHRITDGSQVLRVIELPADNPKAAGMVVNFVEPGDVLYATGFLYPVPEHTFPLEESVVLSKWFVEWLDASGLEPQQHFNIHGQARVQDWQLERLREIPNPSVSE